MVPKVGKKFEQVSILFDHAAHNGNSYLNGHCFVSVMLCVPYADKKDGAIRYISIPLGYRMFTFSDEKVNGYYIGKRKVRTTVFGKRTVTAYVTSTEKEKGTRRLFLSTVSEESVSILKENLPDSIEKHFDLLPMFLYQIRWNIEIGYYEQKTFWSLCHYMVRSSKGIEMMVNLINISYSAMKILPYKYTEFSEYQNQSVQDFRFALGKRIREDVFVWTFEKKLEKAENSEEHLQVLLFTIT